MTKPIITLWQFPNVQAGDLKIFNKFHLLNFASFIQFFLLIGTVFAAPLANRVAYDEYKNQIINFSKKYCENQIKIFRADNDIFYYIKNSIFKLDADNLLDLLHTEDSDKVLVVIFFGYSGFYEPLLVFNDISSLFPLKGSLREDVPLKRIFEN